MCASDPTPRPARSAGFSLIELLVAVVLVAFLMAGMFNIFRSSASHFQSSLETLGIQRNARWGLNMLQEEILQAGYLLPPRPVSVGTDVASQPIIMFGLTDFVPAGKTDPTDEIQVVMDIPLPVEARLSAGVLRGANVLPLNAPGGLSTVKANDIAFVQDSKFAFLLVSEVGTDSVKLATGDEAVADAHGNNAAGSTLMTQNLEWPHLKEAPIAFIRPLQVVRYAVVPRKLDPSDPTVDIPCLVRQMRPLSGNPGLWAPAAATPVADEEILLEGVTGFQIDASLDGGKTWLVQDGLAGDKKWSTIRTAIDTAIKASKSPFVIQARGVDNPKWAAYTPILFRIDLETRTRIQRSEYSKTGPTTAAFRTRRETLMLSPRNFALSEF